MGAGSPKMCPTNWGKNHPGDMAKLADALDLGSSGATRASSSLVISTIKQSLRQSHNTMYYEGKIVAFSFGAG